MNTVTKSTPIGSLGLGQGDHWVHFHVEKEDISFELCGSAPAVGQAQQAAPLKPARKPTGFVEKWGSSAVKLEDPKDAWLTHINEKHLR